MKDKRNYLFLTSLIPKDLESSVRKNSKGNMQDAANALQWHLYEGLCRNLDEEMKILNVLPVGSFPQYFKLPFVKKGTFDTAFSKNNINIGFCNVKLLRKFIQPGRIYRELNKWCSVGNEPKTLFIYTVSAPFMSAVAKIKRKYPNVKTCAIIADLPDMSSLSSAKSRIQELFEKHLANSSYANLDCVDAFVLLTEQMAEYLNINKPFTVMEGIASEAAASDDCCLSDEKTILYTGTLHKRFGVLDLIEAFRGIDDPDYRLIICGVGDSENEIRALAETDKRIDFKGQVTRKEALKLQKQATVLVNPRKNNEEFTKYSFPSKTMEYLASGVPVVAYRLDGIPDEYDGFINYVEGDSAEALAEKLMQICELDAGSRTEMGKKGREFVLANKNAVVQTKKILELIEDIDKG